MASNLAAGLLMCRINDGRLQYFLVHPGGPFYKNKQAGHWSIPKGLPEGTESLEATARREFEEETGIQPVPPFYYLDSIKQKGGKTVHCWTFLGNWEPAQGIMCNTFTLEWPPRSGKTAAFPEVDMAQWMDEDLAATLINPAQIPLLARARSQYSALGLIGPV